MTLAEARLERAKLNLTKAGENFGNKGGGRTPNYLRAEHQEAHSGLLDMLIACLETGKEPPAWLNKSLDVTGKYALGEKRFDLNDEELVAEINRFSAAWFNERSMPELYDSWFQGLREHFKSLEGRSG